MSRLPVAAILTSLVLIFPPTDAAAEEQAPEGSLRAELEEQSARFAVQMPQEMLSKFAQGIEDVRQSGIVESSLGVGDQAPDGQLIGSQDEAVLFSKLWAEGPVVLTFYRGGWCPYCNLQLRALERALSEIENAGATLVAVAPETPKKSAETVEKNELDFLVLSDPDNALARKFGIVFALPKVIRPIYDERIGLPSYNGNDKNELPLSATYIIDHEGVICWVFRDPDYKKRAEPSDIVAEVLKLGDQQ